MFQRAGVFVAGFGLAAEDHGDAAGGIELHHHVGALVGHPDVAAGIDARRMGVGPGVEIAPDLAHVTAIGIEFEQLGGGSGIGRALRVATLEDVDLAGLAERDAGHFAHVEISRRFEEIDGVEADFRRLLGGAGRGQQQSTKSNRAQHDASPPSTFAQHNSLHAAA